MDHTYRQPKKICNLMYHFRMYDFNKDKLNIRFFYVNSFPSISVQAASKPIAHPKILLHHIVQTHSNQRLSECLHWKSLLHCSMKNYAKILLICLEIYDYNLCCTNLAKYQNTHQEVDTFGRLGKRPSDFGSWNRCCCWKRPLRVRE